MSVCCAGDGAQALIIWASAPPLSLIPARLSQTVNLAVVSAVATMGPSKLDKVVLCAPSYFSWQKTPRADQQINLWTVLIGRKLLDLNFVLLDLCFRTTQSKSNASFICQCLSFVFPVMWGLIGFHSPSKDLLSTYYVWSTVHWAL
jgi:hypothetical protein